jgi:hypothetical protein
MHDMPPDEAWPPPLGKGYSLKCLEGASVLKNAVRIEVCSGGVPQASVA